MSVVPAAFAAAVGLAALLPSGASAAQNVARTEPAFERHLAAVRRERTDHFDRLWSAASPERRAETESALSELRHSAGPANPVLALPDLAAVARVLAGDDGGARRSDPLARLADALDLMVVPGFLAASAEDEQPVTVRVYPLSGTLPVGEVSVHLDWVSPAGERRRVRSQSVLQPALAPPGFVLYARAPRSPAAGTWWLELELERAGRRVRCAPVPVECVAGVEPRASDSATEPVVADDGGTARATEELRLLRELGLRPETGCLPSELRAVLAGEAATDRPRAIELGDGTEAWVVEPACTPLRVLLFLAPGGERPSAVLAGARGAAWRALAGESASVLVSAPFAPFAGAPPAEHDTPAVLLERVRARWPGLPVVVVLRGEADTRARAGLFGAQLAGEPLAAALPADLIVSVSALALAAPLDGCATLLVTPPGAELTADSPLVQRVTGAPAPFLTDALLPGIVGRWLSR